jgi:hypothetical protein
VGEIGHDQGEQAAGVVKNLGRFLTSIVAAGSTM